MTSLDECHANCQRCIGPEATDCSVCTADSEVPSTIGTDACAANASPGCKVNTAAGACSVCKKGFNLNANACTTTGLPTSCSLSTGGTCDDGGCTEVITILTADIGDCTAESCGGECLTCHGPGAD